MLNLKCLSNKITWTYSTVWRKKVMRMLSDSLPFLLGFILIWKIQSSIEESNVQRNLNCVCFTNLTKMALINNYNDIKIVEWNKIKREREGTSRNVNTLNFSATRLFACYKTGLWKYSCKGLFECSINCCHHRFYALKEEKKCTIFRHKFSKAR